MSCSVDGCEKTRTVARGYCANHYARWRKYGDPVVTMRGTHEYRFWPKVQKDGPVVREGLTPCWLWTATTQLSGYGSISRTWSPSGIGPLVRTTT